MRLRPHLDPMRWLEDDGCDRLAKWMDAVCTRPSCVNSLPPPEEIPVWDRYRLAVEMYRTLGRDPVFLGDLLLQHPRRRHSVTPAERRLLCPVRPPLAKHVLLKRSQ